jgi:hypothetical protein
MGGAGAFGTPVPGGAAAAEDQHNGTSAETQQEPIDLNDPRLISEPLDVDVTQDAYATPVLPPDGKYRAKLKHEGVKNDKQEIIPYQAKMTKDKIPYFQTGVSASIISPTNPLFDGFVVRPQFGGYVGTLVRKDKSTQIATLLSRIRKPDGNYWIASAAARLNQKEWMDLLIRALAGEPEIGIETVWEWNCPRCGEEAKAKGQYGVTISGMHKFPQEKNHEKRKQGFLFDPEMQCSKNIGHGFYRGYPRIARFLSLEELLGKKP